MFQSMRAHIGTLPLWARLICWPLYGLLRVLVWCVEGLGSIALHATTGTASYVGRGSVIAVLAKVAGLLLLVGLLAHELGFDQLSTSLILFSAAPIMLIGLWYMASSVLSPRKKKSGGGH